MIKTNHEQELVITLTGKSIQNEIEMLSNIIKISQKVGLKKEVSSETREYVEERLNQVGKELGINIEIKKTPYK